MKSANGKRFAGKVVIITGSSSGIGRAAAIAFAKEDAAVVLHGQNILNLDKTEEEVTAVGCSPDKILKITGPMELAQTCEQIIDETIKKFKRIDVLINNAGAATKPGCSDTQSLELLDYLYAVNYRSVVQLSQLAFPYLSTTKGNIVNVSSVAAFRTSPNSAFYGSIKAALDTWTKARSNTFGASGVRINCLNPGPIDTPIFNRNVSDPEKEKELRQMMDEWIKESVILKRFGTSEEMASVLTFLASDDASYITGTTLLADGGAAANFQEVPWRSK